MKVQWQVTNQAINPSSQPPSQVFAGHYVDYSPYDPISYVQNNTGRGGGSYRSVSSSATVARVSTGM